MLSPLPLLLLLLPALSLSAPSAEPFTLIPAVFTPFSEGGSPNYGLVKKYSEFLHLSQNISTVFVGGTNGESLSLSLTERTKLLDAWASTQQDVIMMVGAESVEDATELAAYTAKVAKKNSNVIGVAAMASSFFKPGSVSELVEFMKPIAAAAAPLSFKYYHIPSMTNVEGIDMGEFFAAAKESIPTFTGIK
ncbi:hypothetical protein TeGR_g10417 [Tetraparma gracilis]|jgi:N-acetylneuraminate lyase|uniref:N-acetylneuraminate lyase n=1 Tax=Tetraparma gracilis TaxID=2962635 RepID=A0ABQ6MJY6_9STRA|nr:hypothetical protein TeGR_g10417 [Tetraparma gracilis]